MAETHRHTPVTPLARTCRAACSIVAPASLPADMQGSMHHHCPGLKMCVVGDSWVLGIRCLNCAAFCPRGHVCHADLIGEVPVQQVAEKFKVTKGQVQGLQDRAGAPTRQSHLNTTSTVLSLSVAVTSSSIAAIPCWLHLRLLPVHAHQHPASPILCCIVCWHVEAAHTLPYCVPALPMYTHTHAHACPA